jgi:steroid 5-alpha reductase family enzyme
METQLFSSILIIYGAMSVIAIILMSITWVFALKLNNAGLVDVVWSFGFILLALVCAGLSGGWMTRRLVVAAMICIWSLRLGNHLTKRFSKMYPQEDARYKELKEKAGSSANNALLLVFLWQGLIMCVLMLPVVIASQNVEPNILLSESIGMTIWLLAIVGESTADNQLANFAQDKNNKDRVCNVGLWKYSRHPNYFFEWLIWVGLFIFALSSPYGWFGACSPLVMLFLLIFVTGVKPSEDHSIKSRGALYLEYQRTTSMFFPWFKKETP